MKVFVILSVIFAVAFARPQFFSGGGVSQNTYAQAQSSASSQVNTGVSGIGGIGQPGFGFGRFAGPSDGFYGNGLGGGIGGGVGGGFGGGVGGGFGGGIGGGINAGISAGVNVVAGASVGGGFNNGLLYGR